MDPDEQNLALSQGLLGLGAGLLSGSFGHYGAFAPALGQGISGFQTGFNNAVNSSIQNKLYKAHTAKFLADVDKENRMSLAASQIGGILTGQPPPVLGGQPQPALSTPSPSMFVRPNGPGAAVPPPGQAPQTTQNTAPSSPQSIPGIPPIVNPMPIQPPIQGTPLAPPPVPNAAPSDQSRVESDKFLRAYQLAAANGLPGAEQYYNNYLKAKQGEQYQSAFRDAYEATAKRFPGTAEDSAGGTVVTSGPDPTKKPEFWRQLSNNLRDIPGMADQSKEAMTRAIELDNQLRQQGNQDRQALRQTNSNENTLRDDFNKISQNFRTVRDNYQNMLETSKMKTPAGDVGLIFGFMKIVDPGSSVKEGEYATAQNARGVSEAMRSLYNRVIDGEKLGDNQRQDFVDAGRNLYEGGLKNQMDVENQYTEMSKRQMLDPKNVVTQYRVKDVRGKYGF